jgi:hypothetical protein
MFRPQSFTQAVRVSYDRTGIKADPFIDRREAENSLMMKELLCGNPPVFI